MATAGVCHQSKMDTFLDITSDLFRMVYQKIQSGLGPNDKSGVNFNAIINESVGYKIFYV